MPEPVAVRTRNVKTITSEDLPVDSESKSLGVPWEEYLAGLNADELAICDVYVYRKEPLATEGYLTKVHEAIDRQWLQDRFGGGTFEVTIRNKAGKSHYERNIKIVGDPKLIEREKPAASAAAATSGTPDNMGRLCDLLERTIDRLDQRGAPPAPSAAQDNAISIVAEGAKQAIGLVAEQAKQAARPPEPSRESALTDRLLTATIERLANPPAAPAAPPPNPLLDKLLQTAIDRLLAPPAAAGTGVLGQLGEIASLAEALDKLRGGGAGGGGDWKTALIEQIGQHAPHLVDSVKAIFDARVKETKIRADTAIALRNAAPPVAPPPAIPAPAGMPHAVPTSANRPPGSVIAFEVVPPSPAGGPAPAPPPMAEPPHATQPPVTAEAIEELSAALAQAPPVGTQAPEHEEVRRKLLIVEMLAHGIRGAVIVDALDDAAPVAAALLTQTVRQAPTPAAAAEAIRQFFAGDPILRNAMAAPFFERRLAEVLEYLLGTESEAADEPGEIDAPPPRVQ
jgi:hypothetical protein